MRKLSIVLAFAAFGMVGCASSGYQAYVDAQVAISAAQAKADVERYRALAEIAKTGDSAARVAAVISLNQQSSSKPQAVGLRAPESAADLALRWTSVLLPSVTQIYGIGKNAEISIVNSNNSLEGLKSNNGMVVDLVQGRIPPVIGTENDVLLYPR
jgi:hypothetical protein